MLAVANGFARGVDAGGGTGVGVDAGVGAGPGAVVTAGSAGRPAGADLPPHAATTRRTNDRGRVFTRAAYTPAVDL